MKTDIMSIRVSHETKVAFTDICEDIGLTPSQAIKLFTKAVINYGGIPFELKRKQPNQVTQQAMMELNEGKGYKADSASELFKTLGADLSGP